MKFSKVVGFCKKKYPYFDIVMTEITDIEDLYLHKRKVPKDIDYNDFKRLYKLFSIAIYYPNRNNITHFRIFESDFYMDTGSFLKKLIENCQKLKIKVLPFIKQE